MRNSKANSYRAAVLMGCTALVAACNTNSGTMSSTGATATTPTTVPEAPETVPVLSVPVGTQFDSLDFDGQIGADAFNEMVARRNNRLSSTDLATGEYYIDTLEDGSVRAAAGLYRDMSNIFGSGDLPTTGSADMTGSYQMLSATNIRNESGSVVYDLNHYNTDITLVADFATGQLTGSGRDIDVAAEFAGTTNGSTPVLTGTATHLGVTGTLNGIISQSNPTLIANDAATTAEFAGRDLIRTRVSAGFQGGSTSDAVAFSGVLSATENLPDDFQAAVDEGRLDIEENCLGC